MTNIKKFVGANSREAYRKVREALGAEAVILSNRNVGGAVEILALANEDMHSLIESGNESDPGDMRTQGHQPRSQTERNIPQRGTLPPAHKNNNVSPPVASLPPALQLQREAPQQPAPQINQVVEEIRSIRGMLQSELAEFSWTGRQHREPASKDVLRELLGAGFSAGVSRHLVKNMPAGMALQDAMRWIKGVLTHNLATIGSENAILEKGGVFALVGPTGVGKTTTTAKLAARCVMRHGAGKLALITTDGYRIGAYEQLRIYGKILGVMVHSVKDEADLRIALSELGHKHTVLIDTVGVGQRDNMVAEQVAMLAGAGAPVKRLLCLSATSNGETLSEVVNAYKGKGLAGCIMTKLDEATTIGGMLDVVIREKLCLYYIANGQRVPEDLHVANRDLLVDRAFRFKRQTDTFSLSDDELPLLITNVMRRKHVPNMQGASLG